MRTFTQLTGTTASTNSTLYPASFANLSNNNSAGNVALGKMLVNNKHRYLLEKYFDNERTYTNLTIGAATLTFTAPLASAATSATLSSAWISVSCQQLVVFSNSEQRTVFFVQGSSAVTWQTGLTSTATVTASALGVQAYPIPPTVSKIKNDTITVGQLVYTPAPIQSIQEWTQLNALPYTSDIPNRFFIYNNQVNFWPIPSSSGNIITFNYKARIPDMTFADYSTGTLSGITVGSNSVTGVASSWHTTGAFPLNVDVSYFNLALMIAPPSGDGIWYPIQSFQSDTALTLIQPIQNAPNSTAASYTIGQLPFLSEDFHDMLVYGPLTEYYTTIVKDAEKFKMYESLYQGRLELLEDYAGTKNVNVDLGDQPTPHNPNLFTFSPR